MPQIDPQSLKKEEESTKSYNPQGQELELKDFLSKRIKVLKDARAKKLIGVQRNIESIWLEVDREYTPHELSFDANRRNRFESDDVLGLRSRLIKIGSDEQWQSNSASPDFYVKVNTALSILVDQNPEAVFIASSSRYEANSKLAYSNWKNSWEISGAKQQLKNFIFNQAKYGTAFGRTYPKIVEQDKRIRTEYYKDSPEKDKYVTKKLIKYNDLCRESLNPWQVWISEMARVGEPLSIDDWYYEKEFSYGKLKELDYKNIVFVKQNNIKGETVEGAVGTETLEDSVTVGFYENQVLDIYAVWIPEQNVVLYFSPLTNDDGKLSLWFAPWTLRDDRSIYGIGIFEIIRNDTINYDKIMNMTIDQLVLSIYKMFFYKGTDILGENGRLVVGPGKGEQVNDPKAITFLEVPGPGQEAWHGLQFLQDKKDFNSGVTPQLSAKFAGKTLGQDIQAKDAALERMKTPLDFILDALQQEAYISLSWQKQILSTPEILRYETVDDLAASLKEQGVSEEHIATYLQEASQPTNQNKLLFQEPSGTTQQVHSGQYDEQGQPVMNEQPVMNKYANVYPEQRYSLAQDDKGELIESEENRFYRFGIDIPAERLDWAGVIRVKPQSVLAPSKELMKRMKLDLFNLIYPAIEKMLMTPQFIPMLFPPIKQIIKVYDEDIKDWIDEKEYMNFAQQAMQPKDQSMAKENLSLSIKLELLPFETQQEILQKYFGVKVNQPLFIDSQSQGGGNSMIKTGSFKPLVPRGNINPGKTEQGAMGAAMQMK